MAQATTNLLSNNSLSAALNNKKGITPNPLPPIGSSSNSTTSMITSPKTTTNLNLPDNTFIPKFDASGKPVAGGYTHPAVASQPVSTPTPVPTPYSAAAPAPAPAPTNTALHGGTGIMNGRGQQGGLQGTFTNGQFTPDPGQPNPQVGSNFGGLIGSLAQTAQTGSPTTSGIVSSLSGLGGLNPAVAQATKNLQDFQNKYAQAQAQVDLAPTDIEFKQGEQQVLARQAAAQQGALQQAVQNALQGQGQQISALGTAGGLTNTQQQLAQSGLTSAAQLGQPSPTSFGQTVFNPLTGQFGSGTGGTNLDPQTQATSLAQRVMSGQMTYDQALQSLGYAGNVGSTFLNNAITSAGGNPLQLQAQGATQQTVIGAQGQQVAGYQSALQQGQNLQSQLTDLISTFGLNPNDINAANQGLQAIARNTSDPRYKILQNYVNDIANTYAQVLTPTGGSQTDTTRGIAASMLDATMSGKGLIDVMKSLDEAAKAKIAGVPTTGAGSTGGTSGGGFAEGQTSKDGSLVFTNGKWQAK